MCRWLNIIWNPTLGISIGMVLTHCWMDMGSHIAALRMAGWQGLGHSWNLPRHPRCGIAGDGPLNTVHCSGRWPDALCNLRPHITCHGWIWDSLVHRTGYLSHAIANTRTWLILMSQGSPPMNRHRHVLWGRPLWWHSGTHVARCHRCRT